MRLATFAALFAAFLIAAPSAQESLGDAARRRTFDQILDLYVRNGDVYYRALKSDRGKLDGYVNLIAGTTVDKSPRDEQLAFWLNAYNALVLRTVVDHYPINGRAGEYPAKSIRQIPGAFERIAHRVGGRSLTLDQITIPGFTSRSVAERSGADGSAARPSRPRASTSSWRTSRPNASPARSARSSTARRTG